MFHWQALKIKRLITIKKTRLDTDKDADDLLSRLKWQIHAVENAIFTETSGFFLDTSKPLIGRIDKENQQFILTRIRPPFQNFLPQILISGKLISKGVRTELHLKFKLGIFTTAFFLFLLYVTGQVIWQTIDEIKNSEDFLNGVIWLLIFPVGAVLLTIYEINKLTEKVTDILGIDELDKKPSKTIRN
jgi:hypothetical protein